MTLALVTLHALIIILTGLKNEFAAIIHDGGWFFKVMIIAGTYFAYFWLPFSVIKVWASISKYASIVYMVVQTVFIIDGAYCFTEYVEQFFPSDKSTSWQSVMMKFYSLMFGFLTYTLV